MAATSLSLADKAMAAFLAGGGATKTSLSDLAYNAAGGGGGAVATDAIFDAKGDLAVGTADNTAQKLTVGADGTIPVADSTQAVGLKYVSHPALNRTVTVAYGAAITPNSDTTDMLVIGALTGALTVNAPSGTPFDGQTLRIRLLQDGTGGRVVTWNAIFAFGTDVTAAMEPTAPNSKWERIFEWSTADTKWRATGIVRGF